MCAVRRGKMTVRNIVALIVATLVLSSACYPQLKSAIQEEPVFRAPFTGGWPRLNTPDDFAFVFSGGVPHPLVCKGAGFLFSLLIFQ
jgi:hypothetical protein